jgi:prepilin-type N-terminal cleavage/methylation domain-containing protein
VTRALRPNSICLPEDGFTLVELVVSMVLFAIVATPLAGILTASVQAHHRAQERTVAEQTAAQQIEAIRALPYASVGVVNGNPPGALAASKAIRRRGLNGTMTTKVSFVGDPTRTGFVTGADYKRVVVTVADDDGTALTRASTYVAPTSRGAYGGLASALVRVQVVDYALNTPVANAAVALSTGPSAPRSDLTDAGGVVVFAGLTANPVGGPTSAYDVTALPAGYATLADDVPPSTAAHVSLAPSQSFSTALRVYKPATIAVTLLDAGGVPYAGAATVTVASSRGAQSFAVAGGQLTVAAVAGEPVVPKLTYSVSAYTATGRWAPTVAKVVPDDYPTVLTSSFALGLAAAAPATSVLTVKVQNANGTPAAGARVDVSGGPSQITLTATASPSGVTTFTVPSGTGYTARATGATRAGTATWSGSVTAATTQTVRLA